MSCFCVMEDPLLVQFLYILNPNRYSGIWYKNPRLSHHTNFDPEFSISHHLLLIPWNVPLSSQLSHIKYITNLIIVLLVSFNVQYFLCYTLIIEIWISWVILNIFYFITYVYWCILLGYHSWYMFLYWISHIYVLFLIIHHMYTQIRVPYNRVFDEYIFRKHKTVDFIFPFITK